MENNLEKENFELKLAALHFKLTLSLILFVVEVLGKCIDYNLFKIFGWYFL